MHTHIAYSGIVPRAAMLEGGARQAPSPRMGPRPARQPGRVKRPPPWPGGMGEPRKGRGLRRALREPQRRGWPAQPVLPLGDRSVPNRPRRSPAEAGTAGRSRPDRRQPGRAGQCQGGGQAAMPALVRRGWQAAPRGGPRAASRGGPVRLTTALSRPDGRATVGLVIRRRWRTGSCAPAGP